MDIMKRSLFLVLVSFAVTTSSLGIPSVPVTLPLAQVLGYPLSNNPNDVHFYFYPQNGNPVYQQEIIDQASLQNSAFNRDASTVFLIHGFTDNSTVHLDAVVLPAYLNSALNYNYIVVDWGLLSGNAAFSNDAEMLAIYGQVVSQSIPIVANRTAQFIEFLGLDPLKIHIVGHSLGAHVSGNAGNIYKTRNAGKKIQRITGLDPAGPLFEIPFPFPKLNRNDANFVDIIHTNAGELGDLNVDGHVDFFPNGGSLQPGCPLVDVSNIASSCSHQYSTFLYAASISKQFPACQCVSTDFVTGQVALLTGTALQICLASCPSASVQLGENCLPTARGLYSLNTANPP